MRVLALTQPAHRRHLFPVELGGAWLTRAFRERLASAISRSRERFPGVEIEEPLLGECGAISSVPRVFPVDLPQGAALAGCDENPWETTHVRANGDVVACGDDAMRALGNLGGETLAEIWHGERYRALRRDHALGQHPVCNDCPIKIAYRPGPLERFVSGEVDSAQFLWGWHACEPGGSRWSRQEAALTLAAEPGGGRLRIRGLLPPAPDGQLNRLTVSADGQPLGEVHGTLGGTSAFAAAFSLPPGAVARQFDLRTDWAFEPRRREAGSRDLRQLGFALVRAEFEGRD